MNLPNTAIRFILFFIRRQWVGFLIAFLACVLWAINDVFFPFFLKLIVNSLADFTKQSNVSVYSVVKIPAILLMLFWFATEFILRIQGIILLNIIPRFRANIREAVFNYVKRHSHEFFSSHFAGNIAKKLSELPSSCQNVLEIFFYNFTTALVAFITAFILMWLSHPTFAGLLLLWFVLHMGLTIAFLRIGNVRWEDHSESVSVLSGNIVDSFTNMLNVRLFARGQYESQYIANYQAEEIKKAKKALWLVEISRMKVVI